MFEVLVLICGWAIIVLDNRASFFHNKSGTVQSHFDYPHTLRSLLINLPSSDFADSADMDPVMANLAQTACPKGSRRMCTSFVVDFVGGCKMSFPELLHVLYQQYLFWSKFKQGWGIILEMNACLCKSVHTITTPMLMPIVKQDHNDHALWCYSFCLFVQAYTNIAGFCAEISMQSWDKLLRIFPALHAHKMPADVHKVISRPS